MSTQHNNEVQSKESWLQTVLWTGALFIVLAIFGYYFTM